MKREVVRSCVAQGHPVIESELLYPQCRESASFNMWNPHSYGYDTNGT
jgi:hypothetical protein